MGSPCLPSEEGKKSVGLLVEKLQKQEVVVMMCMGKAVCVLRRKALAGSK